MSQARARTCRNLVPEGPVGDPDVLGAAAYPGILARTVVNTLPVVLYAFTADGTVLLAEGEALAAMGSAPGASVGRSVFDVFADEPDTLKHLSDALAGIEHVAQIALGRNGRTYQVSYRPTYDKAGNLVIVTGLALDITDQLRVEQALEASEARSRQLKDHNQRQHRELLGATVSALAAAVEMRDPFTAGHQRRVAYLARAICNEIGLPAEEAEGIHIGAAIHDIGKIAVPAEILTRPGPLSEVELQMVRQHSQKGAEIISEVPFPWPVQEMILQHHERLDGSGYPRGLSGDQILRSAAIIAVADVVEAFSAHRPYRPAAELKEALGHVESQAGRQFDIDAVQACLALFRRSGFRAGWKRQSRVQAELS